MVVKNLNYNFEFPNIFDFKLHQFITVLLLRVVVDKELLNKGEIPDIQSKNYG